MSTRWSLDTRRGQGAVLAAVLVAIVAAAGLLDPDFPTRWRIDAGSYAVAANDWLLAHLTWLIDPVAGAIEALYASILLWLTLIPAPVLSVALIAIVYTAAGVRNAVLMTVTVFWLIVTGLWDEGRETLALLAISMVGAAVVGIALGVLCALSSTIRVPVRAVLVAMQTIPVFVYLIPVVLLFGPGDTAAIFVTLVYAVPPLAILTDLGIRGVAPESVEAATSVGATRGQILFGAQLPLARPAILAGLNQAVMFAIAMTVVAAMIGAGGLGDPVWRSLGRLEFGLALDAGVALVLVAILLDRSTAAVGSAHPPRRPLITDRVDGLPAWVPRSLVAHRRWVACFGVIAVWAGTVALLPWLRDSDFSDHPFGLSFSFRGHVDRFVDQLNLFAGDAMVAAKDFLVIHAINPIADGLAAMPWVLAVVLVGMLGLILVGPARSFLMMAGVFSIGLVGMWDSAAVTIALVGVAVALTLVCGLALGLAMSTSPRIENLVRPVLDTIQTMPIFLFVIPSVIVMGTGPVAGLFATLIYAIAPTARMTCLGLKDIDPTILEAAQSSGANRLQILRSVRIPLGLPLILTGVSQTILLALAMSVVCAFIGAPGLGQVILTAVGQADLASGLVAGYAMLVLALIANTLVLAGAHVRRSRTTRSAATDRVDVDARESEPRFAVQPHSGTEFPRKGDATSGTPR